MKSEDNYRFKTIFLFYPKTLCGVIRFFGFTEVVQSFNGDKWVSIQFN